MSHGMESNPNLLIDNLSLLFLFYLFNALLLFTEFSSSCSLDDNRRPSSIHFSSCWLALISSENLFLLLLAYYLHSFALTQNSIFLFSFFSFTSVWSCTRYVVITVYITRSGEEKTRALTCTKKTELAETKLQRSREFQLLFFFLYTLLCWRRGHDRFLRQFLTEWSCWKWNFIILWSCTAHTAPSWKLKPSR